MLGYREGLTHTLIARWFLQLPLDGRIIHMQFEPWVLCCGGKMRWLCSIHEFKACGLQPVFPSRNRSTPPAGQVFNHPKWWLLFLAPSEMHKSIQTVSFWNTRSRPKLQRGEQRSETRSNWWHQFDSRYVYTQYSPFQSRHDEHPSMQQLRVSKWQTSTSS